ncbi:HNH endonuclease signature motif containing protein [Achromobacter aegrifaciens]|uniref:HNH endonuclease signature motif containing protein n=1 Tax=Achromobacter aegrifaciens TaxID=1287736 RepID=UPI0027B9EB4E|nr:HNH endonuclease signature motif containing protein [Achromobacter aegrifaciens]WLW59841.1 HNH endonuclease signature motif containing protein [Achromobacter aegrifaciens]
MKREVNAALVRELLDYDPFSGVFTWKAREDAPKQWNVRYAGKAAGCVEGFYGYALIGIDGKNHRANRLAWLHFYGQWPEGVVDHKNGVRTDNRISNLRDVSKSVNGQNQRTATRKNRSTGLLGASLHKRTGKFRADIRVDGRTKFLGNYDSAEEAHQVYLAAKRALHEGCEI